MNLNKWKTHIKTFEDFNQKSIPNELKAISYKIRNDVINNGNNSFNKNYDIGVSINIIINFEQGNKKPYYSSINIYDILSNVEPIIIEVQVEDNTIDINYLMSIISHELRHVYDIFTVADDSEIEDFKKSLYIKNLKNKNKYFLDLVYISLEHELITYYNMLYELYRWIGITDKKELYKIFKTSYTYKALQKLKDFNSNNFLKDDVLDFTKEFSDKIGDEFNGDLKEYYKKWELFFHKKSNDFSSYTDSMLDDIISDIENNKIYKLYKNRYNPNTEIFKIGLSGKLFKKLLDEKNLK